jgi:hypothetical protein
VLPFPHDTRLARACEAGSINLAQSCSPAVLKDN